MGVLGAVRRGIRAFHGSPHDFDRFDLSRIGTGEGAQAYGHGLYFAENEAVARGYRNNIMSSHLGELDNVDDVLNFLSANGGDAQRAIRSLEEGIQRSYHVADKEWGARQRARFETALTRLRSGDHPPFGRMYEVNINAAPEEFLDWDAPLSGQSERAREAFAPVLGNVSGASATKTAGGFYPVIETPSGQRVLRGRIFPTRQEATAAAESQFASSRLVPGAYTDLARMVGGEPEASARLRAAGIPGVRYLDQGSRAAGEGSRNYVVFDDSLIEILRKYGLAGLATGGGGGLLSAAMRERQAA